MRRLIISLIALVAIQSAIAVGRLTSLPCPFLGGELSNSAATSVEDIDEVMPRMRALGLNTVLTPAWFKQDTKRFPRAMTAEGKQIEIQIEITI
jgi:hypothetical protein